jgi:hypothetical protein
MSERVHLDSISEIKTLVRKPPALRPEYYKSSIQSSVKVLDALSEKKSTSKSQWPPDFHDQQTTQDCHIPPPVWRVNKGQNCASTSEHSD